jgi:hypothetical protein
MDSDSDSSHVGCVHMATGGWEDAHTTQGELEEHCTPHPLYWRCCVGKHTTCDDGTDAQGELEEHCTPHPLYWRCCVGKHTTCDDGTDAHTTQGELGEHRTPHPLDWRCCVGKHATYDDGTNINTEVGTQSGCLLCGNSDSSRMDSVYTAAEGWEASTLRDGT